MVAGIIIDLVVFAFVVLSVILGYKKGLIKLGIQLVAFIIAIVATVLLYRPIANLVINTTQIDEMVENTIISKVDEVISKDEGDGITSDLVESAKEGTLQNSARQLSINIVYFGTMLVLYVVIRVALKFITALADAIAKLPILKQFNKLGGIIFGFLRGVLIVYAILLVINLASQIAPENTANKAIDKSTLAKVMYNNNVLNIFLNKI